MTQSKIEVVPVVIQSLAKIEEEVIIETAENKEHSTEDKKSVEAPSSRSTATAEIS